MALTLLLGSTGWLLGVHAVKGAVEPPLRQLLEREFGGFAIESPDEGSLPEPVRPRGAAARRRDGGRVGCDAADRRRVGLAARDASSHAWRHLSRRRRRAAIESCVELDRGSRDPCAGTAASPGAISERRLARSGASAGAARHRACRSHQERGARSRSSRRGGGGKKPRRVSVSACARRSNAGSRQAGGSRRRIATAILIGDRGGLSDDTERRLQEAGTYHVIAISGGNIAILVGVLLGSLGLFGVRGRFAAIATLIVLVDVRGCRRGRRVGGAGVAHGRGLPVGAAHRSAHGPGERDRRDGCGAADRVAAVARRRRLLAHVWCHRRDSGWALSCATARVAGPSPRLSACSPHPARSNSRWHRLARSSSSASPRRASF